MGVLLGYGLALGRLVAYAVLGFRFSELFLFLTPLLRWPLREVRTSFARKVKQVLEIPLGIIPV